MVRRVFLMVVLFTRVQCIFISENMARNPLFDDRTTVENHVISSLSFPSLLSCASHCMTDPMCKSLLYNTITQYCQLLSTPMNSINGPQTSKGWKYYERKFNCHTWHQFMGHWYIWDDTRRSFNDSKTFCANLSPSAYVTEVQSQAENEWLVTLSKRHLKEKRRPSDRNSSVVCASHCCLCLVAFYVSIPMSIQI